VGLNANQTTTNSLRSYFIVWLSESIIPMHFTVYFELIPLKGCYNFEIQGQLRGRTEIAPDQREKFLQKFQQVQQQGASTLLNMSSLVGGNHNQFSSQQQNPLLQQVLFLVHQIWLLLACSFTVLLLFDNSLWPKHISAVRHAFSLLFLQIEYFILVPNWILINYWLKIKLSSTVLDILVLF
jgi:hypothetical protein